MTDYVSKYTLKFNDLASKGFLRTTAAVRGLSRGLSSVALGTGVVATLAAGAAFKLANSVAARGDEFAKLARQVDFSAQSLQRLEFVAGRQGASFQSVQAGVQTFSKRMGEFRAGTGALKSMLKKLDPEFAKQLKATTNNQEAYELFLEKIAETTDAQEKAALASAAVSKQGARDVIRLTASGTEAIRLLSEEADRLRPPLSDADLAIAETYSDSMFDAQTAVASLGDSIGIKLMPLLGGLADEFADFVAENRELINLRIETAIDKIATALQGIDFESVFNGLVDFVSKIDQTATSVASFIDSIGGFEVAVKGFIGLFVASKVVAFGAAFSTLLAAIGPIGWAILAVTAVGAGLYANWDRVKQIAIQLGTGLSNLITEITGIENPMEAAKNVAILLIEPWKQLAMKAWELIIGAKNLVSEFLAFVDPINKAKEAGNFLKDSWVLIGFGADMLVTKLSGAWTAIETGWTGAMNAMKNTTMAVWEAIKGAIGQGINFLIDKINAVISQYNAFTQTGFGEFAGLGQVELIKNVDLSSAVDSKLASLDGTVKVTVTGEVTGAKVQANAVGTGIVDSGGSNSPLEGAR